MRTVNHTARPAQTARTAIPLSGALLLGVYASLVVWLYLTIQPLAIIPAALLLWPIIDDRLAGLFSDHVVYMLYKGNEVIYVGETDDVYRRMYQHTDGVEHTWWRDIHGYNVARHCWTDKQAKRLERRMIAVINRSAEKSWCDKLKNEIWDDTHTEITTRLTLWWWKAWYLFASHIADCRAFHAPNRDVYQRSIPPRPEAEPESDGSEDWRGGEPRAERHRTEATYERTSASTANHAVTILALPPVSSYADRCEPDRNEDTPSRREGEPGYAQNRNAHDVTAASEQTTLSAKVREAHNRRAEAVLSYASEHTTTQPTDPTAPTSAPRRRGRTNAERQKAYRERQKAKRQQADRSPTTGPSDGQPPRQGRGDARGEGHDA